MPAQIPSRIRCFITTRLGANGFYIVFFLWNATIYCVYSASGGVRRTMGVFLPKTARATLEMGLRGRKKSGAISPGKPERLDRVLVCAMAAVGT